MDNQEEQTKQDGDEQAGQSEQPKQTMEDVITTAQKLVKAIPPDQQEGLTAVFYLLDVIARYQEWGNTLHAQVKTLEGVVASQNATLSKVFNRHDRRALKKGGLILPNGSVT